MNTTRETQIASAVKPVLNHISFIMGERPRYADKRANGRLRYKWFPKKMLSQEFCEMLAKSTQSLLGWTGTAKAIPMFPAYIRPGRVSPRWTIAITTA